MSSTFKHKLGVQTTGRVKPACGLPFPWGFIFELTLNYKSHKIAGS